MTGNPKKKNVGGAFLFHLEIPIDVLAVAAAAAVGDVTCAARSALSEFDKVRPDLTGTD